uniref:replication-associated recombination protein A n=1 Tax=Desulforadius tongensis TaxID=1216062 RepID=UPI001EE50957|nr:replication-associated recombination protein A [Desulforadius tongensis]
MRPRSLDEFVGQQHILAKNKLLYRAIKAGRLGSAIFYGPPGTGKTALAEIIACTAERPFERLNAVTCGVKDMRAIAEKARRSGPVIMFMDEIHHLNKSQQDALLPFVEQGLVTLIGSTTENPYFEVNDALRSRSTIFQFKPLQPEDIEKIIKNALADKERGLGNYKVNLTADALEHLVDASGGDARSALNALELGVLTTEPDENGVIQYDLAVAEECLQQSRLKYDKAGDSHYDVASALIKSIRGSDPHAALHYLARMLAGGEDVKFIARRLVISAAEDVGLAQPQALQIAIAGAQAVQFVGMPEARIILGEVVIYLALCPKSNSAYQAIDRALWDVRNKDCGSVPLHLRDAHYKGAAKFGHGTNYKYAHDYPGGWVDQQYLPDKLVGTEYYRPKGYGVELKLKEKLNLLKSKKAKG